MCLANSTVKKAFQLSDNVAIAYGGNLTIARKCIDATGRWMQNNLTRISLNGTLVATRMKEEFKAQDLALNECIYLSTLEALVATNLKNDSKLFRISWDGTKFIILII